MPGSRPLPEVLEAALRQAHEVLARDPRGDLPRGHREAIWAALGARDEGGRRRRAILGIEAVGQVLPEWERVWPRDRMPHQLLAQAAAVLDGSADRARALDDLNRAFTALDNLVISSREKIPAGVGYGAARALATALDDEVFDPSTVRLERTDADVDPYEHDPGYLAAVVRAGGPPWDPDSSSTRRREFWEWWLREAVPAARAERSPR